MLASLSEYFSQQVRYPVGHLWLLHEICATAHKSHELDDTLNPI
jgi:hypothetical protein